MRVRQIVAFLIAAYICLAVPLAAQDDAPPPALVREPTATEKATIDRLWQTLGRRIASGYWTGVIEMLEEIEPLIATTYGREHPGGLQLRLVRADALAATSQFTQAEAIYAEVSSVIAAKYGKDSPSTFPARLSRAANLINLGRLDEAAGLLDTLGPFAGESAAVDPLLKASIDANLAHLRRIQGRFAEAEVFSRRAVATREAKLPPDAALLASARAGLARSLIGLGRVSEAGEMAKRWLDAYSHQDIGRARLLMALAEAKSFEGKPQDAAENYYNAAKIFMDSQGFDFPDAREAGTFSHMAKRETLGIGLTLDDVPGNGGRDCEQPPESLVDVWKMRDKGDEEFFPEARVACFALIRTFVEPRFGAAAPLTLDLRMRQLDALIMEGNADTADAEARSLFPLALQTFGANHPVTQQAAVLFARVLLDRGREEEARALTASLSGVSKADAARDLATFLDSQGRFAEGEKVWQTTFDTLGTTNNPGLKRLFDAVAGSVFNAGYQAKCDKPLNAKLIEITQDLGWLAYQRSTLQIREARAIALACEARWAEAVKAYDEAYFNGGVTFQDPAQALYYARKALTLARNPAYLEQANFAASNAVLIARERRYTPDRDADGKPLGFRRMRDAGIDPLAITFAAQIATVWADRGSRDERGSFSTAFEAAQDYGLSSAAASLLENAARRAVRDPALLALIDRQEQLAGQLGNAEALLARGGAPDAAIQTQMEKTAADLAAVTGELRRTYPAYAEATRPFALKFVDLQQRLRPGEAILLIQPVGHDIYSFAVSRDAIAWNKADLDSARVDELVARMRCRLLPDDCTLPISGSRLFDAPAAAELYRQLVAPVAKGLGNAEIVYGVTSGGMASIPLGLLIVEPGAEQDVVTDETAELDALAKARWFGSTTAIATLPSVSSFRVFETAQAPPAGQQPLAGIGDPVLGPPAGNARSVRNVRLTGARDSKGLADVAQLRRLYSLPGTRRELKALANTLNADDAALVLGNAATESAVKRWPMLRDARVVAFATHAALPSEIGGLVEPGLILTPPATASATDDGYLSASEVAQLELSAAIVILSACNTAGPNAKWGGESLSGLARAFLFAGAQSMLVSHWVVSDDVGPAITGEMFRILNDRPGTSRAEALRLALEGVRTGRSALGGALPGWKPDWADPWAWAPFVLVDTGG